MEDQRTEKKKRGWSCVVSIGKETVRGFMEDNVMRLSASLAYATLFSIIPFLSLLVTVGIFFHMDLVDQLYTQLEPIVGDEVVASLQSVLTSAEQVRSSSWTAVVSMGMTFFGATTVFAEIQDSLNAIWGIKAVPKRGWLRYLRNRLLSFSIILVFALIMLITFSVSNIIVGLSNHFMDSYPDVARSMVKVGGWTMNLSVTVFIFMLVFKVLPDARMRFKDVFVGALVTSVLLVVGQWAISFYIGVADVGSVYGAAAFVIVFITWIYYSAIIIYIGAEFTKAWADQLGGKIVPDEYAVALKVITVRSGEEVS